MNYTSLVADIATWMKRTDLTAVIPSFVETAQYSLNRELGRQQLAQWEQRAETTTTQGDEGIARPTSSAGIRTMKLLGASNRDLLFRTPAVLDGKYSSTELGIPDVWTLDGNEIRLRPVPGGEYTIQITYWKVPTPISASNATNWYTDNEPDLLLFECLHLACLYVQDDAGAAKWRAKADVALMGVKDKDCGIKWSGEPLTMVAQ